MERTLPLLRRIAHPALLAHFQTELRQLFVCLVVLGTTVTLLAPVLAKNAHPDTAQRKPVLQAVKRVSLAHIQRPKLFVPHVLKERMHQIMQPLRWNTASSVATEHFHPRKQQYQLLRVYLAQWVRIHIKAQVFVHYVLLERLMLKRAATQAAFVNCVTLERLANKEQVFVHLAKQVHTLVQEVLLLVHCVLKEHTT